MAQLENDHIVRYNHSWMETRPAQPDGYDSEFDEENEDERYVGFPLCLVSCFFIGHLAHLVFLLLWLDSRLG